MEDQGAFTGECSGKQVKDAGADYVIVGHSERRQYFNETDDIINKKVFAAFRNRLTPIVCVGETLGERETGETFSIIDRQVSVGLRGLRTEEIAGLVIAYEPVWAIGTGKTAMPEQVEEVHLFIRGKLMSVYGEEAAGSTRILYGGSVKPGNSSLLLSLPNVDGALVGGASLKADDFIRIIKDVNRY